MRVLSRAEIAETARLLASDSFCASITEIALGELHRLSPPKQISSLNYSIEYRKFRKDDGALVDWSLDKAPWSPEVFAALDNNGVREVLLPKPARCGGTVLAENYALKGFEFGPTGDVMWYLAGPGEVDSYADREFKFMFEDHKGVAEKIGSGPSDNKIKIKKIGGHTIELMAMSAKTTTNRQARLIVLDEPDSYNKKFASNFLEQGRQRQRMIGNQRKIFACSHPDIGWSGGISQAWLQSSRGIYVMQCPCCNEWGSPYPTKHWPDVPKFKLNYQKSPERTPIGERLKRAEETASLQCPNNGCALDDAQRIAMITGGRFMHAGQHLDIKFGVIGDADSNETMGFWVHVLMVPQVNLAGLAKEMEAAVEHHERTGKIEKIKQVMVRTFGEVFEGAAALGLDAAALKKRTVGMEPESPVGYRMGEIPDGVKFLTAQVDTGGSKFDYLITGWDLQRRRYFIDRRTIKTRRVGDLDIDIHPTKVQDDWNVLISQVIDRVVPFKSYPTRGLPIAITVIDIKDGNATPYGVEFLRRMMNKKWFNWRKVYGIMGAKSKEAPELGLTPKEYNRDSEGRAIEPPIQVFHLGVHKLKEDALETLAIEDGSAGQNSFPIDFPSQAYDELFNEPQIEGVFVRNGPQETLDLSGYSEAARQMLTPDLKRRQWDQSCMPPGQTWTEECLPIWAQPVSLVKPEEGGDPAVVVEVAPVKKNYLEMLAALDQG